MEEDRRPARRAASSASPTRDNFWAMGDTGPCGPCSEIFYDHGDEIPGRPAGQRPTRTATASSRSGTSSSCSSSSWPAASASTCRGPSIDTGMGLERIAAVLQGTHDNYDIDLFRALIARHRRARPRCRPTAPQKASHRVIADHLRASAFLIADGVLPSNEGRGYVLRRIMRRAMRHAELLGASEPLMWQLVPALVREMGQAYPELVRAEALITETLKLEETRFRKTLERGLAHPRRGDARRSKQGDMLRRRDRVQALRHLRLSARPDAGRAARRAASASISTRFNDAMEPSSAEGARVLGRLGRGRDRDGLVRDAREGRRDRIPRLRDRERRRRGHRAGQRRQGGRRAEGRRDRRGGPQPDAVLRRVRRPGRRHRRDDGATASRFAVTDTQKEAGDLFVHHGKVEQGALKVGDALALEVDHARRARDPRATIRRRICCTRRCARCSAITSRRRARWSRPTGCASTSRIPSR